MTEKKGKQSGEERSGKIQRRQFWRRVGQGRGRGDLKMISTVGQSEGSSWRKESQK